MRRVRVRRISGYNAGEIVSLPYNQALTYCRNGQADPEGWSIEEEEQKQQTRRPTNRMLDTREDRPGSKTRNK